MVPSEVGADVGSAYDWQLETAEQEYLDGHSVRLNQGKVLGGGTVLNGLVWTRSAARDYDVWADLNNLNNQSSVKYSWRWDDLLPYFQKVSWGRSLGTGASWCDAHARYYAQDG